MSRKIILSWFIGILVAYLFLKVIQIFKGGFWFEVISTPVHWILIVISVCLLLICLFSFKEFNRKKWKTFLLPLLPLFMLWLLLASPLDSFFKSVDFHLKIDKRIEVIEMLQQKQLQATGFNKNLYPLPNGYRFISDGGEVVTLGDKVLFFDILGVVDNFSGYVYSPDGSAPTDDEVNADIIYIRQINPNWYLISCT